MGVTLEVGQTACVKEDGEWIGVEVLERQGNWYRVKPVERASEIMDLRWYSAVPFEDYVDEDAYEKTTQNPDIVPARVFVMRQEYYATGGWDTCSVSDVCNTLSEAVRTAQEGFKTDRSMKEFTELPEAVEKLAETHTWNRYGEGRDSIHYWFRFSPKFR